MVYVENPGKTDIYTETRINEVSKDIVPHTRNKWSEVEIFKKHLIWY